MDNERERIIRRAVAEDASLLARILRRSFEDVAKEFGLNPEKFTDYQDDWVRDDMAHGITFFILEVKGLPAGCVGMTTPQDSACEMKRLGVLPEHRHRGLGKALVDYAIARATSLGLSRLNLDLIAANARLRRWYEGLGFAYAGTRTVEGVPFEIGSMTLELS
jgi:diamine N-acetyltransferase